MDLNVQDWKEFKIPSLFDVDAGIYHYSDEYEDGDTPYVSASDTNNGIGSYISLRPDFEGNKITTGKVGCTAYYQPDAFCATSDVNVLSPKFDMSAEIGMFISRIINFNENYKWAYGRQCRVGNTKAIIIKLPIQHNPDGTPIIDADKTYSDEGYVPDWQFMEDYIKSLHSEPITTTRGGAESLSLGVDKWREFNLSDVFIAETGNTDITQELLTDDGEIVVSAGEGNTGVIGRCSVEARIFPKNTITLDMFGFAFPRPYEYKMVTHARIFSLSVKKHIMSCKQSIFMATMLNNSGYKYAYGRMCSWERVKNDTISLPIQRDASGNPVIDPDKKYSDKGYIPDWDFMERYIDSLPYSDKIA